MSSAGRLGILLLLALAAVPAAATVPEAEAGRPRTLEVPKPDLSAMEEVVRRKVEAAQASLERLLASPGAPPGAVVEAYGYLGQLYHAFRLLDAAERCYAAARSLEPQGFRWSYYLGLVRFTRGELEQALADFEAALELRPGDFATLIRAGTTLLELGRVGEARQRFERALADDPDSAAALYGLGKAAALDGDDAAAVARFERALELAPEATVIHYPLGQAYRRLGRLELAMENLSRRGEQEPGFPDPLGNQLARLAKGTAYEIVLALARDRQTVSDRDFLGFALSQFADVEGAIEQLEFGLAQATADDGAQADPGQRARIHYVLGALLVNARRDAPAIDEFRAALELDPRLLDARVKLGNALARAESWEEAVREYSRVLAVEPGHRDALLKRAAAQMARGRSLEARADLEKLLEIAPELAEAHIRLALVLEGMGDVDGAVERYRRAAELELPSRDLAQVRSGLAWLLVEQGELDEAAVLYRAALEVEPGSVPALSGLAGLAARGGRFAEAAALYGRWRELDPTSPDAALAEARALIFAGRWAAATEALESAAARFPKVIDFRDVLARHLAACPDRSLRDGPRALELALEVYRRLATAQSMETLAMAYAEAGRFEEAADWQERLITQVGAGAPEGELARLRRNLEAYRRGEPCCPPPPAG